MVLAFAAVWIGLVVPAMAQDNDCVGITEKAWGLARAGGYDGCKLVEQLAPYCVPICKQLVLERPILKGLPRSFLQQCIEMRGGGEDAIDWCTKNQPGRR